MRYRRRVRLDYILAEQKKTRDRKGVHKRRERARRDARNKAKLAANLADGKEIAPEVASWVARRLGKPVRQASKEELQALAA